MAVHFWGAWLLADAAIAWGGGGAQFMNLGAVGKRGEVGRELLERGLSCATFLAKHYLSLVCELFFSLTYAFLVLLKWNDN